MIRYARLITFALSLLGLNTLADVPRGLADGPAVVGQASSPSADANNVGWAGAGCALIAVPAEVPQFSKKIPAPITRTEPLALTRALRGSLHSALSPPPAAG